MKIEWMIFLVDGESFIEIGMAFVVNVMNVPTGLCWL